MFHHSDAEDPGQITTEVEIDNDNNDGTEDGDTMAFHIGGPGQNLLASG